MIRVQGTAVVIGNTAGRNGGGIAQTKGTLALQGSVVVANNEAATNGGGIAANEMRFFLLDGRAIVEANSAVDGAGIHLGAGGGTMILAGHAVVRQNT
ncbi:MAG: hypothetical protein ACKOTZ_01240, partial [Chloroflexota bacterium]